jgi:recombination associated protein RdgC
MYRNLTMFRFPSIDLSELDAALDFCALKPVGPLELSSRGFVSPFGRDSEVLAHRVGNCIGLTVGGEDKILPASVVNDLLAKKLAEVERAEGRKPGGRARKRMKEDIVFELLPRAMVKPSRLDGYLDLDLGVLFVDTASRKQAENFVSEIRHALGSFPALPLNAEVAPRSVLTDWMTSGYGPAGRDGLYAGLVLGDEATLKDPADKGATVRVTHQDLAGEEMDKHLEAGKQATRLALTFDDRMSFTLDEDLAIRKLKFLDAALETLESTERDDLAAELDARFALMSGELARLFPVLEGALSLSKAE